MPAHFTLSAFISMKFSWVFWIEGHILPVTLHMVYHCTFYFQSIVEKVIYKVSKENPNWTVAERSAWIDSQVFGFGRAIQAFGLERFRKNCQQMVGGFNHVLMTMFPLTATSLPHTSSDEATSQLTQAKKETLKDAAKKATDIAKSKAGPIYASCQPNQT